MKIFCIFVADLGFEPRQAITVSRLWASRFTITLIRNVIGCEGLDLNQRPLAYETSELPTALPRNVWLWWKDSNLHFLLDNFYEE